MKKKMTAVMQRKFALAGVLSLSMLLGGCNYFKSAEQLRTDASAALAARNFSVAAQLAQDWTTKASEHYEPYFVLAQAQAQAGDKNAALVALEQAIRKGLKDDVQINSNANLDPIKSMVAYGDLMKAQFPGRGAQEGPSALQDSGNVSITEKDGKQVLRAGDVVIEVPSIK